MVNGTERRTQRRGEGLPLTSPRVVYFPRHPHLGLAGLDRADQATGVFLLASRLPGKQSTTYFGEMTNSAGPLMRRISVAAAKAQFSAVLAQAEAGEEVVITRRGVAIARIVAEPTRPADGFDPQELCQFTDAQPMHEGPDAGTFMAELRRDVRY